MTKAYMVHSEHGRYSDWEYDVEGIFSSRERAVSYVKSRGITAYHYVGEVVLDVMEDGAKRVLHADNWLLDEGHYERCYPGRESTVKLVDTVCIVPTTTDGVTFRYVYPDGKCVDPYDEGTYYVTEYEMDEPCYVT